MPVVKVTRNASDEIAQLKAPNNAYNEAITVIESRATDTRYPHYVAARVS